MKTIMLFNYSLNDSEAERCATAIAEQKKTDVIISSGGGVHEYENGAMGVLERAFSPKAFNIFSKRDSEEKIEKVEKAVNPDLRQLCLSAHGVTNWFTDADFIKKRSQWTTACVLVNKTDIGTLSKEFTNVNILEKNLGAVIIEFPNSKNWSKCQPCSGNLKFSITA